MKVWFRWCSFSKQGVFFEGALWDNQNSVSKGGKSNHFSNVSSNMMFKKWCTPENLTGEPQSHEGLVFRCCFFSKQGGFFGWSMLIFRGCILRFASRIRNIHRCDGIWRWSHWPSMCIQSRGADDEHFKALISECWDSPTSKKALQCFSLEERVKIKKCIGACIHDDTYGSGRCFKVHPL